MTTKNLFFNLHFTLENKGVIIKIINTNPFSVLTNEEAQSVINTTRSRYLTNYGPETSLTMHWQEYKEGRMKTCRTTL